MKDWRTAVLKYLTQPTAIVKFTGFVLDWTVVESKSSPGAPNNFSNTEQGNQASGFYLNEKFPVIYEKQALAWSKQLRNSGSKRSNFPDLNKSGNIHDVVLVLVACDFSWHLTTKLNSEPNVLIIESIFILNCGSKLLWEPCAPLKLNYYERATSRIYY